MEKENGQFKGGFTVLEPHEMASAKGGDRNNDSCSDNATCNNNGTCKGNGGRCVGNGRCGTDVKVDIHKVEYQSLLLK